MKSKKLKTLLVTLGFKPRTTLKELFCPDLSRAILLRLNDAQFYRLKADAKRLEQDGRSPRFRILAMVRAQLKEFISLIRDDIVVPELL